MFFEITAQVYLNEISGDIFRSYATHTFNLFQSIAQILLGPITIVFVEWRWISGQFIILPTFLLLWVYMRYLTESPRHLYAAGHELLAVEVLARIAHINRKPPFHYQLKTITSLTERDPPQFKMFNYLDLIKNFRMLRASIVLCWLWFFRYLAYYGYIYSLSVFEKNFTFTLFLAGIAEIIGSTLTSNFPLNFRDQLMLHGGVPSVSLD